MIRRITLLLAILSLLVTARKANRRAPPFGSLEGSGFDTINRQNLNERLRFRLCLLQGEESI